MDILVGFWCWMPGYTAKVEIKKWPIVGLIGNAIGTFYMNRVGTKVDRELVV